MIKMPKTKMKYHSYDIKCNKKEKIYKKMSARIMPYIKGRKIHIEIQLDTSKSQDDKIIINSTIIHHNIQMKINQMNDN